jgi:hypothetical protein
VTSARNWRRRVLVGLVFVVAAAVLVGSWRAAMNAAAAGGRPMPWLWPVSLEAFIFVLVLVYWDARAEGRRARGIRALLALTTGVACTVQVLDAPASWLGWLTAAWTPVALLLSIEVATWLLYGTRARPDWPPPPFPDPDPVPVDTPADPAPPTPVAPSVAVYNQTRPGVAPLDRTRVAGLLDQGLSASAIQREVGLSKRRYVADLLPLVRELKVELVPSKNGDGP